ncbi:MAG: DUF2330 domain-containing protein [Betaproteobacteria bacterium]
MPMPSRALPSRKLLPVAFAAAFVAATLTFVSAGADAFCGFFVGKADAPLGNRSSQVIVARHERKTVISMLNEYRGEPAQFALVVPVPQVLERGQVHVGDRRTFERIDAFTAPRLAEYRDPDPCIPPLPQRAFPATVAADAVAKKERQRPDSALGVAVEARYTVGEYEIVVLSAKESDGLETWLRRNGYRIPAGASAALRPYVLQNMKFFVARVDLAEHAKTGRAWLSPLQFAFESPKFMLPVRLGMLNADGPQDLVVYMLTKEGRVETTNYRTVRMPTNVELPAHVRDEFGRTYQAIFDEQVRREGRGAIFTEFFWDMGWCDPCSADPLSPEELRAAGAFWIPQGGSKGGAQPAMVTRLHLRYTRETLPEDLAFQETADRAPWQVRYVLRTPWSADANACPAMQPYLEQVRERQEREATTLASLTGGDIATIRTRMNLARRDPPPRWWETLWPANR